jgi:hypothetical protein
VSRVAANSRGPANSPSDTLLIEAVIYFFSSSRQTFLNSFLSPLSFFAFINAVSIYLILQQSFWTGSILKSLRRLYSPCSWSVLIYCYFTAYSLVGRIGPKILHDLINIVVRANFSDAFIERGVVHPSFQCQLPSSL